ncbi:MAG: triphosphoribosyl-dephospho-CoA synthase [Bacteroidales bacterium]|nr:triphosphoribosyl-dephospho-CoA synthase [Bacteroidales bacterium]
MYRYENHTIQELPLSVPHFHNVVERFLGENGLRLEALDSYFVVEDAAGRILAGAGMSGDLIKCIAVASEARSVGLVAPLVSHLISQAASRGITELKLFTKPENGRIFESLGFHVIARAPLAVLMENGRGLERYGSYLRSFSRKGRCGAVVMNANPFTLGHRYLLEQAASRVDALFVIPVREDSSSFHYQERIAMIRDAAPAGVSVLEGSAYQISAATFPTYFLKDLSDAAETQMRLDLDLFAGHIAPALGVSVRFVGSEPSDALTARYNELMKEVLPEVVEIPRLNAISASAVRAALDAASYASASALCPKSTLPYLLGFLADRALRLELDTPLKPGLVGLDSNGAHQDMDYRVMREGIEALRPFWPRMASAHSAQELRELGLEAEKAMLEATGGVNTHRGAIFALGLALYARGMEMSVNEEVMQNNLSKIAQVVLRNSLDKSELHSTHGEAAVQRYGVKGARAMATEGYQALWSEWLPLYRFLSSRPKEERMQLTLLKIMSTLDDTCVIHRAGYERAQEVKKEAEEMLRYALRQTQNKQDWKEKLKDMCGRYAREGISPGGAADMLALTIFTDSIIS